MTIQWIKVDPNEKVKPGRRKVGTHRFESVATKRLRFHWPVCCKCGLVALKNEASRKEATKPCVWFED